MKTVGQHSPAVSEPTPTLADDRREHRMYPFRATFRLIDDALNTITMYRLVLYYLIGLIGIAIVFCFLGILPYDPFGLFFSAVFLTFVCWVTNTIFARTYKVPTNMESAYI